MAELVAHFLHFLNDEVGAIVEFYVWFMLMQVADNRRGSVHAMDSMEASREALLELKMRQEGLLLFLRDLARTAPQGRFEYADEAGIPSYPVDVVLGQLLRFIDAAIPAREVLQQVVLKAYALRSKL